MKRSYVCKFLVQLEEKGYIYKKQAIRGKRQIIMENYITPEGEKVYKNKTNEGLNTPSLAYIFYVRIAKL